MQLECVQIFIKFAIRCLFINESTFVINMSKGLPRILKNAQNVNEVNNVAETNIFSVIVIFLKITNGIDHVWSINDIVFINTELAFSHSVLIFYGCLQTSCILLTLTPLWAFFARVYY